MERAAVLNEKTASQGFTPPQAEKPVPESALPPERKTSGRKRPKLGPLKQYIDHILEADREAPRKQRHTAHRIYTRLRNEQPEHEVSESQVRRYVRARKQELGLAKTELFVPQSYAMGQEAQADWYEAAVKLGHIDTGD